MSCQSVILRAELTLSCIQRNRPGATPRLAPSLYPSKRHPHATHVWAQPGLLRPYRRPASAEHGAPSCRQGRLQRLQGEGRVVSSVFAVVRRLYSGSRIPTEPVPSVISGLSDYRMSTVETVGTTGQDHLDITTACLLCVLHRFISTKLSAHLLRASTEVICCLDVERRRPATGSAPTGPSESHRPTIQ